MNVRWSERVLAEFTDTAAYVANEFGKQAAIKCKQSHLDHHSIPADWEGVLHRWRDICRVPRISS